MKVISFEKIIATKKKNLNVYKYLQLPVFYSIFFPFFFSFFLFYKRAEEQNIHVSKCLIKCLSFSLIVSSKMLGEVSLKEPSAFYSLTYLICKGKREKERLNCFRRKNHLHCSMTLSHIKYNVMK